MHYPYIKAILTCWVDEEPQPGLVQLEFTDAHGKLHVFQEKNGTTNEDYLDENSSYPVEAFIPCIIIERRLDDTGREIILVDTGDPFWVESLEDSTRFEIEPSSLIVE